MNKLVLKTEFNNITGNQYHCEMSKINITIKDWLRLIEENCNFRVVFKIKSDVR